MSQTLVTQLLLLLAGAILGIVGTAFKSYLDRRTESRKNETAAWLDLLAPLRVAAEDLSRQLKQVFERVQKEENIREAQQTDRHNPVNYLQFWFWQCKDYATNPDENWPDDQRLQHFALHSGGMGNEANGLALSRFSVICVTPPCVIDPRSPVQGSRAV